MIPDKQVKAKELDEVPRGYRGLGPCLNETHRAYLFQYYGHEVWIPKKVLVKAEGGFWAPAWAIDSSKNFKSGSMVDHDKQRRNFERR
ncbi:hypothetical protein L905_19020 [Agrobacterium sp. TS43]|uniref:hypothetical protein n=1 Tax=Agrobacterium TaxID=357 RepID=UPI0004A0A636|nr:MULTISPECIES: hypothetical protein [Agrobacterium]KDR87692.1 hypothetical protein K538_06975 [Agrobacterium tumefaciens GW4]KVK49483.1 hypothetical protein L903_19370 [Agrobacterium sp. JL28]KVK49720.1 hypothetical protein L904_19360 [Agrobacterium sp. LY4]KVK62663.1 hypothetical protein L906_18495 [Agrobacterium sp. TS45]KVK65048.1 hypothetical protein L905_19020 [Agrobacterium sp. TS43]